MKKGHIFFIMWISGAWKGTLIENLKKQEDVKLDFLSSYVTREIRAGEVDWNIYNFISRDEFTKSIDNGEFLEYKLVHKLNYYWTKREEIIDNGINLWKKIIKEIEVEGLKDIFLNNPDLKEYITTIFLDISKEILLERIEVRWAKMSEEELNNRLNSLENEKKDSQIYCDYIIDTSDKTKDETLEIVLNIIKK